MFARAPVRKAAEAKDLTRLGISIHTLADSFSHAGFKAEHAKENVREGSWRPNFGHFDSSHGGHGPDLPFKDVDKAMRMAESVLSELQLAYAEIHGMESPAIDRKQLRQDLQRAFSRPSEDSELRSAYWRGVLFVRFDEDVEYDPTSPPPGFVPAMTAHEETVKGFTSFEKNPYMVLNPP